MQDTEVKMNGISIWFICTLFFLYEFFLRTIVGSYQPHLMHDLSLTSFEFSLLSTTVFMLIYGVMQLPAGLIVDNIGLKKSLLIGTICCTLSCAGFAYSSAYSSALLSRVVMGFGASFGFICMIISVYEWLPRKYIAIFIGLSQFIGTLGPMLAAGPVEALIYSAEISWRSMFSFLALIGATLTALAFYFVENNRETTGQYTILYKPENPLKAFLRLFKKIQPWYIASLSAFLYCSVEYFSENEGRAFLILKGVSANSAAYMITMSWLGYAIGSIALGIVSDFFERRRTPVIFCAFLGLFSITTILYSFDELYLQAAFLLLGISAGGQSIGLAMMVENFRKQFVAIGFALNNAMVTIIGAINAPAIAILLDKVRDAGVQSLDAYLLVFSILIVFSIIAVFISVVLVRETYCKSTVELTILRVRKV